MRLRFQFLILLLCPFFLIGQNDTINQKDEEGRKQGYWVYYGKDRPTLGMPAEGKVEEGTYVNDRKEGIWTKYQMDGVTPKLRGEYHNNRPNGTYEKFHENGVVKEKGCFTQGKYSCDIYWYYHTGQMMKKIIYTDAADSSFVFFENGCLQEVDVFIHSSSPKRYTVTYRPDSCNAVQDTSFYGFNKATHTIDTEPQELEFKKQDKKESKIKKVETNTENSSNSVRYKEVNRLVYSDSALYNPNGPEYQKRINSASELIFDGTFKDGRAWDGKFYFYDNDGILLQVEIWADGKFNSLGKL